MSELRRDPITGRWTIVAENRLARPNEYAAVPPSSAAQCPFCGGHESWTPSEVAAYGAAGRARDGPGWTVRTVPNKFPTLSPEPSPASPAKAEGSDGPRPGVGYHEVVIEGPEHAPLFPGLPPERVRQVLRMLRERARVLESQPEVVSLVIFENSGPESGGTLFHPHAQLVAVPTVPPRLEEEARAADRHSARMPGECLFERVLDAELRSGPRIVATTPEIVAYAPYASELPYEVRCVPRRHAASLSEANEPEVDRLAELLPAVLRALGSVVPAASYNYVTRSFASSRAERPTYHWHLDVLPRLVRPDGFEVGTGVAVNPVAPERAARELRAAGDFRPEVPNGPKKT